jgi:hypothetical protein
MHWLTRTRVAGFCSKSTASLTRRTAAVARAVSAADPKTSADLFRCHGGVANAVDEAASDAAGDAAELDVGRDLGSGGVWMIPFLTSQP